jgi:hypothetical protein
LRAGHNGHQLPDLFTNWTRALESPTLFDTLPPGGNLAGLLLTDHLVDNEGNLWVWSGTHRSQAAFFAERGSQAFAERQGWRPSLRPSQ